MDYEQLAQLLFPEVTESVEDMLAKFPPRNLPQDAKVTRIAPSPTGFMHLGNLYGALVDERLAHQSGGVFFLRIEDTDKKRSVENGVEMIIDAFSSFKLIPDEGVCKDGEKGEYGPYYQSLRAPIYHVFVKDLIRKGHAYPCFCSEDELMAMREQQEANKETTGYYGKYAKCRDLTLEDVKAKLDAKIPYVIRFRSNGCIEHKIKFKDLVRGDIEVTENDQDLVLLKSDGIPTYHFAHVIDDHLMGTTHVVRGEEWLPSLPMHLQLFETMGWKPPKFVHTSQLMKIDEETGQKRKLSKRKDPELALSYYHELGYPSASVMEYLLTMLNSNFEEWRMANPNAPMNDFKFTTQKMSSSGALFDINKLNDVSKNVIARMTADEVYDEVSTWAESVDPEFYQLFTRDTAYTKAILSIGRGGRKPRKDIGLWSEIKPFVSFFFDELFTPDDSQLPQLNTATMKAIARDYVTVYNTDDDNNTWFEKLKAMCPKYGFCADMKAYKENPSAYAGSVADLSMVLRVLITGRAMSPDLCTVCQLLGKDRIVARLERYVNAN